MPQPAAEIIEQNQCPCGAPSCNVERLAQSLRFIIGGAVAEKLAPQLGFAWHERWRTLYHEAGHVVMALIAGIPLQGVTVQPEVFDGLETGGHVKVVPSGPEPPRVRPDSRSIRCKLQPIAQVYGRRCALAAFRFLRCQVIAELRGSWRTTRAIADGLARTPSLDANGIHNAIEDRAAADRLHGREPAVLTRRPAMGLCQLLCHPQFIEYFSSPPSALGRPVSPRP